MKRTVYLQKRSLSEAMDLFREDTRVRIYTPEYRIFRATDGVIQQAWKQRSCIPHYIDFPVKDRKTWEDYKSRMRIDDPIREFDYRSLAAELNSSTLPDSRGSTEPSK